MRVFFDPFLHLFWHVLRSVVFGRKNYGNPANIFMLKVKKRTLEKGVKYVQSFY